jgi:hypothetical protein
MKSDITGGIQINIYIYLEPMPVEVVVPAAALAALAGHDLDSEGM